MSFEEWEDIFEEYAAALQEDYRDSWRIEFDDSMELKKPGRDWFQYISGAYARFQCSLCRKTWPSRRVLVLFHFRLNRRARKGTVKVRRFRQQCRRCHDAQMEEPDFHPDNITVLLKKLVDRIRMRCYGEELDDYNTGFRPVGRSEGPHEAAHCEACHRGICRKAE